LTEGNKGGNQTRGTEEGNQKITMGRQKVPKKRTIRSYQSSNKKVTKG